eukprot:269570-Prorocentrum_minimum.AAC.1
MIPSPLARFSRKTLRKQLRGAFYSELLPPRLGGGLLFDCRGAVRSLATSSLFGFLCFLPFRFRGELSV